MSMSDVAIDEMIRRFAACNVVDGGGNDDAKRVERTEQLIEALVSGFERISIPIKWEADPFVYNYTAYALSLFRAAASASNYVVCPSSLGSALALLMDGSKDKTSDEICKFLSQEGTPDSIISFYGKLTTDISASSDADVYALAANTVFVDRKFSVNSDYKERVEQSYGSTVKSIDLTRGAQSAQEVNKVIATATNNVFTNSTRADSFNADTALLLLNTITFEGAWATPFSSVLTQSRDFKGLAGVRKELIMYEQHCTHAYYRTEHLGVVELPYKDPSWSLFVLKPSQAAQADYNAWLRALSADQITDAMQSVKKPEDDFSIYLPKFSIDVDISFKHILMGKGVAECFAPTADLSEMSPMSGLFVQEVQQKVVFVVDEAGTRAAAETDCYCTLGIAESFYFDRPFLFILAKEKIPVFIGQFV